MVVKELPNELLIYDLKTNKAFCLNETARLIMDQCDGATSVDQAIVNLNPKLGTGLTEEMVWMVVEQFERSNFLKDNYAAPVRTTKVSRRRILETAASLGIALPIVTSLVAPSAIQAQSGCIGLGGECQFDADVSGCCEQLFCIPAETRLGGQCAGCIPLGAPCTNLGDTSCCTGSCQGDGMSPTGFTCLRDDA